MLAPSVSSGCIYVSFRYEKLSRPSDVPSKRLIALRTAMIANARAADTLGDIHQMSCEQWV